MPTDKPRFTITVDPALMQEIEDYRYNHRIKNQTQAVISLMQRGLQEIMETEFSQPQQPVEQYSADEQHQRHRGICYRVSLRSRYSRLLSVR